MRSLLCLKPWTSQIKVCLFSMTYRSLYLWFIFTWLLIYLSTFPMTYPHFHFQLHWNSLHWVFHLPRSLFLKLSPSGLHGKSHIMILFLAELAKISVSCLKVTYLLFLCLLFLLSIFFFWNHIIWFLCVVQFPYQNRNFQKWGFCTFYQNCIP